MTASNKRIAKNTLMLYSRQLFILLVNLYTVRVLLNVLGVEDYGTYNVVAGIVALFSFLSNTHCAGGCCPAGNARLMVCHEKAEHSPG